MEKPDLSCLNINFFFLILLEKQEKVLKIIVLNAPESISPIFLNDAVRVYK